jgi:translation initiation factor 3 subunit E
MLAEKLNSSPDDAERWIVNLIREARLDAKIDAKEGHVVMNPQPQSVYQRVIDKTKSIGFQTQFLSQSTDKLQWNAVWVTSIRPNAAGGGRQDNIEKNI